MARDFCRDKVNDTRHEVHIIVSRGLNLSLSGTPSSRDEERVHCSSFSIDFRPFRGAHWQLLIREGEALLPGQPVAKERKSGVLFTTPVEAKVSAIVRGEKRALCEVILRPLSYEVAPVKEDLFQRDAQSLLSYMCLHGLVSGIRVRPFSQLVHPDKLPRSIFIQAVESAPFIPAAEWQVAGREEAFGIGVRLLRQLTDSVHLVTQDPFFQELGQSLPVDLHTIQGPHPMASPSLHIQHIDPIMKMTDIVWSLSALEVVRLGHYCMTGQLWIDQLVAIAGEGFPTQRYVRTFPGVAISDCIEDPGSRVRLVSGDPLTGSVVGINDHLCGGDSVISAIPEPSEERKWLHFFRWNRSFSRANGSRRCQDIAMTTDQHGEERAFIDGSLYEKVMPFHVIPILLVKALLADDMEKAVEYGLLEIVPEDFALADFISPSKSRMMEIVRDGQSRFLSVCLS